MGPRTLFIFRDAHPSALPANDYHFVTEWRVDGTVEEVLAILRDAEALTRWWPSVYLDVRETSPGDARGVGRCIALHTKGWLPYTLRWSFTVTEAREDGFAIAPEGDFVGRGNWVLRQVGSQVAVTYDWRIRAEKPMLRRLSWLLKPIFRWNHHWAMARGEESLKLELARRRAKTREERARIAEPPAATFARAARAAKRP